MNWTGSATDGETLVTCNIFQYLLTSSEDLDSSTVKLFLTIPWFIVVGTVGSELWIPLKSAR